MRHTNWSLSTPYYSAARAARASVSGLWRDHGPYAPIMTQITTSMTKGRALPTLLCLLAGLAALGGLAAVAAALMFGIGTGGLIAALLCGALALGAGSWAAVLAFGAPPQMGAAAAPES